MVSICPLCHVSVISSILPAVVMELTHFFQVVERYYHAISNMRQWIVEIASSDFQVESWMTRSKIHLIDSNNF